MKKQLPAWLALCIIALAAGLLLALTNQLTADRIEEQNAIKANAARASVLPAATEFKALELNQEWVASLGVDNCYEGYDEAGNLVGYTSQITVKGYGGEIEVVVGMDLKGAVTGVSVGGADFAETAGLGAKTKEPAFTDQFIGLVPPAVLKENVDSVTGASISSGAVVSAVNNTTSYMYFQSGLKEPEEDPLAGAFEVRTATAQGFAGPVTVQVALDENGVITGLVVGDENFAETTGLGERAKDSSFREQFVGKSGTLAYGDGIDALAGATITSNAVMQAVNEALGGEAAAAQPTPEPEPTPELAPAVETLTATAQGFGGPVEVTVGLDADGNVVSMTVGGEGFAETAGLGAKAQEAAFTNQFLGKTGPFAYGENGVEAITGATVTSTAVMDALNSLFGVEPAQEAEPAETAETAAETGEPAAQTADGLTATAQGFGGPVEVAITLNEDGAIATMTVGGEGFAETAGLGAKAQEAEFTDQFVGKTGPFAYGENGVEAITGATVTSTAVLEALNSLFPAEAAEEAGDEESFTATAQGFGGPVEVTVTVNEDGTIATMTVGGEGFAETEGLGAKAKEAEFTGQFVGKAGPFTYGENGIEAITGATVTSNAVLEALNGLYTIGTVETIVPDQEPQPVEAVEPTETAQAAAEPTEAVAETAQAAEETAEAVAETQTTETAGESESAATGIIGGADGPTAIYVTDQPLTATAQGFGGPVEVTVTLNEDGTIATMTVGGEGFAETAGLGAKAQEAEFTDQFVGKTGPFAYGENGVEAITGATVTSTAVLEALNSLFPAEAAQEAGDEGSLTATAQGFGGPVEVTVTLNQDGTIASMTVGGEGFAETAGLGAKAQEAEFTDQFLGKAGPFTYGENGVDAIAGATVTSAAVLEALNSLF